MIEEQNDSKTMAVVPSRRGAAQPQHLEMGWEMDGGDEQRMGLRDYLRILRHHLWLALGLPLVATAMIAYLMIKSPDYYDSTAVVEINLESTNPALGDTKNYAVLVNNDPAYFNTQLQLITSPALLRTVVTTLNLDQDPVYIRHMSRGGRMLRRLMRLFYVGKTDAELGLKVTGDPLDAALQPRVTPDELTEATRLLPYVTDLAKRITLEPVKEARSSLLKDTRLVNITVRHPNAKMATKLANAVADALVFWNSQQRQHKDEEAGNYLRKRIGDLQNEIAASEQSHQAYSSRHGILSLEPGQNTAVDRLMSLNRELVEAENARKLAESEYEVAQTPNAALALAEEATRQIADAEAKLSELRQKRSQLLVTATEKWPEVREVDQQISTLQSEVKLARERASQRVISNLRTKYLQAKGHEDAVRTAFVQQRQTTEAQNEASVEYRLQEQRIHTNKALLENLLQRLGENVVGQAATTNNIRVVDYALSVDRPEPSGPFRLLWITVVFLLSATTAIIGALVIEHMDDTFHSGVEVASFLRLPALAVIPTFSSVWQRMLPEFVRRRVEGESKEPLLWDPPDEDTFRKLTESYRRLRTSLTLSMGPKSPRTILITSGLPGEGKSTTAANLAASMAQAGHRVLLVDGDTRLGRLHAIFNVENKSGLTQLLSGTGEFKLASYVQTHSRTNVDLVTCGTPVPNGTELLSKDRLRELFTQAAALYDMVLVDSSAMTACPDSLLLSWRCDAALFVVRGGKTSRELAYRCCSMLRSIRTQVLGVVINNLAARSGEVPNYYYYGAESSLSLSASAGR